MSGKVRLLSENVANMIAAGEVVERPASVVKELVENSLDAGAGRIHVDVVWGGRKLIRVTDDGEGMGADDALLALERHATSKIASESDLFSVATLGFRGEALPAIASISKLTLRTAIRSATSGTCVRVEGGTIQEVKEEAVPPGTDIEIAELFFNTPARRKFLRSPETELSHIVETFTRLALPKEGVFFRLRQEGKVLLQVPESADLQQRIAALLGPDAASGLVPIDKQATHFRVHGFISGPETTRSSPNHMFVYCNGRYLRDRLLTSALTTGYRGHILKGRYPVVALMIEIPAELVDVNVHPTKSEVRFRQPSGVYEGIVSAIDETLRNRFGIPDALFGQGAPVAPPAYSHAPAKTQETSTKEGIKRAIEEFSRGAPQAQISFPQTREPGTREIDVRMRSAEEPSPALLEPEASMDEGAFSGLAIVGQIFDNYIVCETRQNGGMMALIDAHAAHERILFEKLKSEYNASTISVQAQLLPVTFELRHAEAAALLKAMPALAKVGIEVEPFGGETFRITAIPAILSSGEAAGVVRECIELYLETGRGAALDRIADGFLSVVACHSAVRSGQELTVPQMREILRGMDRIAGPGSCPHGRPTFWTVPLLEIEKRFKRK
jgi:DNA mismatch repair protein MutL